MPPSSAPQSRLSAATTRTRSAPARFKPSRHLLAAGQDIRSPQSGLRYRIGRILGEGGFGQAYLARRMGTLPGIPGTVCIKVSQRIDGWVREAYFGQLLDGHSRAIRVFDAFPLLADDGQVLYCLALEYATGGDLRAYLRRTGKGWPESVARREIA